MILRYSSLKKLTGPELNRKALKIFGTSNDPYILAFLTPEGVGISGGQSGGNRIYDHRQIASEVLGGQAEGFTSLHHMLCSFLHQTGDIRVVFTKGSPLSIHLPSKEGIPTQRQLRKIVSLSKGSEIFFDITNEDGRNVSSGSGNFASFVRTLEKVQRQEKELSQDLNKGTFPRQLKSLAEYVRNTFQTKEDLTSARNNPEHPQHARLRQEMDKCGIGVTKIWSDFGLNSIQDFYERINK